MLSMFLFIGGPEIAVIILFVLILFGSKKIPDFARMMGKGMREFRRATDEIKNEINEGTKDINDDFKDLKSNLRK
jgi:sec-independent protein translocase protein TatA